MGIPKGEGRKERREGGKVGKSKRGWAGEKKEQTVEIFEVIMAERDVSKLKTDTN